MMPFRQSVEGTEAQRARADRGFEQALRPTLRARVLKAEVIEAATAAALQTAIQAWFDGTTEEEFIEMYSTPASHEPANAGTAKVYTVTIIYTI